MERLRADGMGSLQSVCQRFGRAGPEVYRYGHHEELLWNHW
jgi:hypothetical protein